jgi:pyrimidine operon attenuation protein/uracil phosphoribosyltransferase
MEFVEKARVMDAPEIGRALSRLASEIVERSRGIENLLLVGIRRRGVPLAERIAAHIRQIEGTAPAVASLDIAFYRDDLSLVGPQPVVTESPLPVEMVDARVVLVDDVLYTGRTVWAAVDHLLRHGRPSRVQLAVLIDRGHREIPIHADFVGRAVPTKGSEIIKVMLPEFDEAEQVLIVERPASGGA